MRKITAFTLFFCLFCCCSFAQTSVHDARQASWQKRVYRISADTAEKYIEDYTIYPHHYLTETPFVIWHADTAKFTELPVGNYLIISVKENELVTEYYCQSDIRVFPINNQYRVQLEVKGKLGQLLDNAKVWINRKEIFYDEKISAFQVKQKRPDEAIVRITIPGDTLFVEFSAMENIEKNSWQQWWANFGYTTTGKIVSWPVRKLKNIFSVNSRYRSAKRKRNSNLGYMVFNKPKYQPGDTVKFKAYILNRRGKQVNHPLDMWLQYSNKGRYTDSKIRSIQPQSPSAYLHEFVLGDSLASDQNYTVAFKDKKGRQLLKGSFKIEDYVLDEVASYSLRSEKEVYYKADTMVLYANAKDANGLALMDGKVNLYITRQTINFFYEQRVLVPDTLWKGEQTLAVAGDTKFEIPTANFPAADLSLKASVEFRNANNEIQEKEISIDFVAEHNVIDVKQENGCIVADYKENGISVPAKGRLAMDDNILDEAIVFPFRRKIDVYAEEYSFSLEKGSVKNGVYADFEVESYYQLLFNYLQLTDTAGFSLYNPNEILVHYTVFDGKKIIAVSSDSAANIRWSKRLNKGKMYRVEWNYIWKAKECKGANSFVVLDKVLSTSINGAAAVFPGQKDTITIAVKDYKGRPAKNVNLTAVSYNTQFGKDIRVQEPPYIKRYKNKKRILFDDYELDDAGFTSKLSLGKNQEWINTFSLDSMTYYQFLFPGKGYTKAVTAIKDFMPQVAVHITKQGVPQEVYMLYINREFVWYNGVTDKSKFAFNAMPGYTQVGIRLYNQYIEIDSIYLQPFYKHDFAIDVDKLPPHTKIETRPVYYTPLERYQMESQLWQLKTDGKTSNAYVWQPNKLVYIGSGSNHIIGPFATGDSLQYYKPYSFDIRFSFEPFYQYQLTPKMARLERTSMFPGKNKVFLPEIVKTQWILGDTIVSAPVIDYREKYISVPPVFLKATAADYNQYSRSAGLLQIKTPYDSIFKYAILYAENKDTTIVSIRDYSLSNFYNIQPGNYTLILVTDAYHYLVADSIQIEANATYCLKFDKPVYQARNTIVEKIRHDQEEKLRKAREEKFEVIREEQRIISQPESLPIAKGNGSVEGVVIDKKGNLPIYGAVVSIKGYNTATYTSANGNFTIKNIKPGNYILVFSSVGYGSVEKRIIVEDFVHTRINISMEMSQQNLDEVVVIGYASTKRKSMTGSISVVNGTDITGMLQGKVAGVSITSTSGMPGTSNSISIRGANSLGIAAKPLYVIDGVPVDELPEGIDLEKLQINILKDAAATSIYGSRAANGVILITTTSFFAKSVRDEFRDYAFWKPNLFTDDNGEVKFSVTYPDNITSWQTFVVGMDKKRRFTKTSAIVKSFKPLLAQLSAPQFLIEGDSSYFIGKTINYAANSENISSQFSLNAKPVLADNYMLAGNGASTTFLPVRANGTDTILAKYALENDKGYKDGELRKIPVFKKGIEEAVGKFWIAGGDSNFSFQPDRNGSAVTIHIQNNTLDVLLDELKQLNDYPYYCMEQTASKLRALVMQRQINNKLNKTFTKENEINKLVKKLQDSQLFDGSWSWWGGGNGNLAITSYIARAMLLERSSALVETNIRNAALYLHNQLSNANRSDLLESLYTLCEIGHEMDYEYYLRLLPFDSLTIHQQWQVVSIKQQRQLNYQVELKKVFDKRIETMLGGTYWGANSYYWVNNDMATTVLAFRVLERTNKYSSVLQSITQFFLERRNEGRWRNTVESANVVATILPGILQQNENFTSATKVEITADEVFTVEKFPYTQKIDNAASVINIKKQGGGTTYITAWQSIFNSNPAAVADKFELTTQFKKSGNQLSELKAGEKSIMVIKVVVKADAEYVQLEIPIPAGCTYAEKRQGDYKVHKEFLKNKMLLFVEKMNKGVYEYEVELEPRYSGVYHLNPAKAELMYFPVFYGRNEMKKINITK